MVRWKSIGAALTGSIALLAGLPATAEDGNAIDPMVVELIETMSSYIAGLDSWQMTGASSSDVRLDNGMLAEQISTQTVWVDRPGRFRSSDQTETVNLELYLDDGLLTIYRDDANYYGQVEAAGTIGEAMNYTLENFDIEAPLLDFIQADISARLMTDVVSAEYLGISRVRDETFHHVAMQGVDADVQLWISTGDRPLPGRLIIASKWETGAPRYTTTLDWDVTAKPSAKAFRFSPPKGASRIDVQPQD
ncbi:MAG: DUF2092 domain-containing protein [Gammaproteobacteria bacterium]